MNKKDKKILQRILRRVQEIESELEEWQDIDRTMLPGHMDKVFNNYGSGRSDR